MDDQNVQDNVNQEALNTDTQEIEPDTVVQETPEAVEAAEPVAETVPQEVQAVEPEDDDPDKSDPVLNKKFDMWERKLLDLSLRNNLLNARKTQMIRLIVADPATMEDRLNSDKDYKICPLSDADLEEKDYGMEGMPNDEEGKIAKEFESDKIYTDMTRGALDDKIKDMFRKGKVVEEENGASSLYLATTFLKWRQKDSDADLYAPILLIPCEITRKSIVLGYKVRRRDEDTLLNITIIEKLRQDFGIEIPDFDSGLPQDESGVDVDQVKKIFKAAIEGLEGWDVVDTVLLGLFSFSRFVMWNDLHKNRYKICKNEIVRSLCTGLATEEILNISSRPDNIDQEPFLPLTADSSQIDAIWASSHDETFVLHGPPGTGKSQTITSMIADGIANDRTILFVAEKKVALDVVYSRLEKIGIAPFCLELHSNKAKKSHIVEQLRIASEIKLGKTDSPDYDEKLKSLKARREELDKYVLALHEKHDSGYTVYELINMYAENSAAPDVASFPDGFFDDFKIESGDEIEAVLGEMAVAKKGGSDDLSFVRTNEYSQTMKDSTTAAANACKAKAAALREVRQKNIDNAARCGVSLPSGDDSDQSLKSFAELISECLSCSNLPPYLISQTDNEKNINDILAMSDIYASAFAIRDDLLTRWDAAFFNREAAPLLAEFDDAQGKIGPLRSLALSSLYKKIRAEDKTAGQVKNDLRAEFVKLDQFKQTLAKANSIFDGYRAQMPEITDSARANALKNEAVTARDALGKISHIAGITSFIKMLSSDAEARTAAEGYKSSYDGFVESYGAVNDILTFKEGSDFVSLDESDKRMDIILANVENLRGHVLFNNSTAKVRGLGAVNLAESFINGEVTADDLIPAFRKRLSKDLAEKYIDSEECLKSFSSDIFEEKVRQFAEADDEFVKVTRQEIYMRLAKKRPDLTKDVNPRSGIGIMQHAIKSRGRGISIRTLMSEMKDVLLKICPCMLMSPISVAQYLEPGKITFDTVIFDEASQIPTAEAVGVLARGNNAVIVGDPNQMPPTTFFQAMQTEETYDSSNLLDGDGVYDDLESILDDCLAVSMPSMYLAWHYRSRHESLITFSNRSFYDGKLYTFPSADNRVSKVSLVDMGGTFERGKRRVNEVEANAVADDIYRRFKESGGKPCSIGVVTFNINQQNLIDDLIMAKCAEDRSFEEWLYDQEEPIFVKNLENVQGDERDVILFSVAYGKDEEGKIYMNFGPLNRDGGWRRLNVAVTRSRSEMKVFSSLRPEDIKINEGSSDGVIAFRRFLDYAAGSSAWDADLEVAQSADSNNPIIDRSLSFCGVADQIIARLEQEGYTCDKNIGKSSFKVDIGVCDKEEPDAYKLGILLDGSTYNASKTTSAREVSQPSLLKGLGWNLVRVRVIEWWEDPDSVMAEIRAALERKEEKPVEEPVETEPVAAEDTEVAEEVQSVEEVKTEDVAAAEEPKVDEPVAAEPVVAESEATEEVKEEQDPPEDVKKN